jgi:hypothetical protein
MSDCIHICSPPADMDNMKETQPPPEYPAGTIAILRLAEPALLRVQGACVEPHAIECRIVRRDSEAGAYVVAVDGIPHEVLVDACALEVCRRPDSPAPTS